MCVCSEELGRATRVKVVLELVVKAARKFDNLPE